MRQFILYYHEAYLPSTAQAQKSYPKTDEKD